MPPRILDYQRIRRPMEGVPWYRWDWVCAIGTLLIIAAANAALLFTIHHMDGLLLFLTIFFGIPMANVFLAIFLIACSGIYCSFTGSKSTLHVAATLFGCPLAIIVDFVFIATFSGWS